MGTRRQTLQWAAATLAAVATGARAEAMGGGPTVLAADTDPRTLIYRNPAELDASRLPVTPLEGFGVMGLADHRVDLAAWRLSLTGRVGRSLSLSYAELLAFPVLERRVLLICPGVFANHGTWRGLSLGGLLAAAQAEAAARRVIVTGAGKKRVDYPLEDVLGDRVFLAYQVNGGPLPVRHGYPLRVVAEGYYGYDWVKYAQGIEVA